MQWLASILPILAIASIQVLNLTPAARAAEPVRVVDLGHTLSESAPSWSGGTAFEAVTVARMDKNGYFARRFTSDEHFGTHLDAPAHFAAGGWTVDRIPPDRLVRTAVTINVESRVRENEDYRVTLDDLKAMERASAIPEGALVLIATGWDARWNQAGRYMNERGGVKHFPGLSVEAATYLARDRKVAGIGIDTPSIDYGPSSGFEAHHATQPHNVYHVENAANLTKLPRSGFRVVVAPIALEGGSGGPTRMFALLDAPLR